MFQDEEFGFFLLRFTTSIGINRGRIFETVYDCQGIADLVSLEFDLGSLRLSQHIKHFHCFPSTHPSTHINGLPAMVQIVKGPDGQLAASPSLRHELRPCQTRCTSPTCGPGQTDAARDHQEPLLAWHHSPHGYEHLLRHD